LFKASRWRKKAKNLPKFKKASKMARCPGIVQNLPKIVHNVPKVKKFFEVENYSLFSGKI